MRLKPNEIVAAVIIVGFIAAVAVLAIYPALSQAPQNQCIANLKNVGTAIGLYAGDNGGFMVRPENWTEVLAPRYMDTLDALVCPSARPTQEQLARYEAAGGVHLPIGYALFGAIAGANANLAADPAKTPTLFDSSEYGPNATADLSTVDFRHVGKIANIMYADGHQKAETSVPTLPKPLFSDKPPPPPAGEAEGHEGHGH